MPPLPTQLDEVEARILGCLVEKSLTTPELYPLTLNALVNACNQKSSREPVMSLDFSTVESGLKSLLERSYAGQIYEAGARAPKYTHRMEILLASEDPKAVALLCVLFLRGPQTVGELKTRTERLCAFESLQEVDALLQSLAARPDGPVVSKLPRQPGQKEARYRQLFTAHEAPAEPAAPAVRPPPPPDRVAELEQRVAALEARLKALEAPK